MNLPKIEMSHDGNTTILRLALSEHPELEAIEHQVTDDELYSLARGGPPAIVRKIVSMVNDGIFCLESGLKRTRAGLKIVVRKPPEEETPEASAEVPPPRETKPFADEESFVQETEIAPPHPLDKLL